MGSLGIISSCPVNLILHRNDYKSHWTFVCKVGHYVTLSSFWLTLSKVNLSLAFTLLNQGVLELILTKTLIIG